MLNKLSIDNIKFALARAFDYPNCKRTRFIRRDKPKVTKQIQLMPENPYSHAKHANGKQDEQNGFCYLE